MQWGQERKEDDFFHEHSQAKQSLEETAAQSLRSNTTSVDKSMFW